MIKVISRIKYLFKRIFQRLHAGSGLNKLSQSELEGAVTDFLFLKLVPRSINIFSFNNGMTIRGIKFNNYELDPFGNCLSGQNPDLFDKEKFSRDLLQKLLREDNKVICDFNSIFNNSFKYLPIPMFYYPWENFDFFTKEKSYNRLIIENRNEYLGQGNYESLDLDLIAKSHANQFCDLINIIARKGFDNTLPRPRVIVLKYGKRWRWIMSGQGNHRAYILKYLGYPSIPVEIAKFVDFDKLIRIEARIKDYGVDELIRLRDLLFSENENPLRGIL